MRRRSSAGTPRRSARPPRRTEWFKSSRSNPSQNCVEIRFDGEVVGIRDSKNVSGPRLCCATESLSRFVASVRSGDLGL